MTHGPHLWGVDGSQMLPRVVFWIVSMQLSVAAIDIPSPHKRFEGKASVALGIIIIIICILRIIIFIVTIKTQIEAEYVLPYIRGNVIPRSPMGW